MLIRCNPGCKLKDGNTTGSLDLDTNEVICDYCQEEVSGISNFAKNMMKSNGDIIRKNKNKPFQFECKTCDKTVETALDEDDNLVGTSCDGDNCSFEKVTKHILHALKAINRRKGDISYE